jgi:hypothetical protein
MQFFTHSCITFEALGGLANSRTFIRKKVIEVSRSTVDLRSLSFAGEDDGKNF